MLRGTPEFVATQQQRLTEMAPRAGVSALLAERRARRLSRVGAMLATIARGLRLRKFRRPASVRVNHAMPQTGEGK